MRIPRFLAAIAVLVGLWNAVLSRLDARDPAPARGAYPVQRPTPSSRPNVVTRGQSPTVVSATKGAQQQPIFISSRFAWNWQPTEGGGRVHLLRGGCQIAQGSSTLTAQEAVIWIRAAGPRSREQRVQIYLEGRCVVTHDESPRNCEVYATEWTTTGGFDWEIDTPESENLEQDVFYQRALKRWNESPAAQPRSKPKPATSKVPTETASSGSVIFPEEDDNQPVGERRLRFFPRSSTPFNAYSFESANTTPAEQILVITNGVNLVISDPAGIGTVDLRSDHMVVWTQAASSFDEQPTETLVQRDDAPLQIYLEGNIIVQQEDPVTHVKTETTAQRAFYDLRENRAILQKVEVKVKTPAMPLSVRIRAEEVRQQSKSSFHALNAWVTTSQFGKPGYRIGASDILFDQRPVKRRANPAADAIQQAGHDDSGPVAGIPEPATTPWITTLNPTLWIEDVPVGWLPRISGQAQSLNSTLTKFNYGNDRIFGQQVRLGLDPFKLFGREAPEGVTASLLGDYLSKRGPAAGLISNWQIEDRFGLGKSTGLLNAYGIHDDGVDNLGLNRRHLAPADPWRGRFLWRDRQEIGDKFTLMTELGYISDRNFLEQYFEPEWDTGKDNETLAYLKYQTGDTALTAMTRARINDFDTTTEWLPKADLYVLGRSLFDGRMNWSTHTSVGFANLRPGVAPTDPADIFTPLPYVADRTGLVTQTRHEVTAPFMLGQMNIVPYALGEAAYFSQDLNGDSMLRLYGSAGVRGSLMFTKVMPEVQSSILGLRGLVHKMVFDFDYSISDSSQNLGDVAQYNEFDDQAQYRFRNRLITNTFGGILPDQFDPRFYAVRSGAAHNVTAPYFELVDSQQVLRLGWRHRWQTQAGPIDNPRVRDWMTLDLEASYFPNANRDNFGQSFGLLGGRYAFNVSERTSILANGYYDLFDNAQQLWNVGIVSQRSERGSVYLGVRQVKGAGLDSEILTASYSYQMSPKWVSTVGTAYDLAEGRNRGQSLTVTRIGQDFLMHLGANIDASKNNVGLIFSIEPKFLQFGPANSTNQSNPQLGSLSGGH